MFPFYAEIKLIYQESLKWLNVFTNGNMVIAVHTKQTFLKNPIFTQDKSQTSTDCTSKFQALSFSKLIFWKGLSRCIEMASDNAIPKVPTIEVPTLPRNRLASIRQKIDDKELLLEGEIPERYLKSIRKKQGRPQADDEEAEGVEEEEEKEQEEEIDEHHKTSLKPNISGEDVDAEKDPRKSSIPIEPEPVEFQVCTYCRQSYHPDRIESHREICKTITERNCKVPFLVKLGIKTVDSEKDEVALVEAEKKILEARKSGEEDGLHIPSSLIKPKFAFAFIEDEILEPLPTEVPFPGGGCHWKKQHENFMRNLEEYKQKKDLFAAGQFPDLPRPPDSRELEVEFVQCPYCIHRFFPEYNAVEHIKRCGNSVRANCYKVEPPAPTVDSTPRADNRPPQPLLLRTRRPPSETTDDSPYCDCVYSQCCDTC